MILAEQRERQKLQERFSGLELQVATEHTENRWLLHKVNTLKGETNRLNTKATYNTTPHCSYQKSLMSAFSAGLAAKTLLRNPQSLQYYNRLPIM